MRIFFALVLLAACGGSGDDEPDNPCPTGDCTLPGRTTIKWTLDAYPEWGFSMDSCTDFGVGDVQVSLLDANNVAAASTMASCGNGQVVFSDIPAGDYTVNVTPLDAGGAALVSAAATGMVSAGTTGNNQEVTVNVPWDSWVTAATATGTFLFRIQWGGMSCETTTVKYQTVKLTVNDVVQTVVTDWNDQKIDGNDKQPCKMSTDSFPQSALGVQFGPATFEVTGFDMTNTVVYTHTFDTFVGAGITNPTLTFDVPTM
jgi:hypothetical protein